MVRRRRAGLPQNSWPVLVGKNCNVDLLIDGLQEELRDRPYDPVTVVGGCSTEAGRLTRPRCVLRQSTRWGTASLSGGEATVLMAIAFTSR